MLGQKGKKNYVQKFLLVSDNFLKKPTANREHEKVDY